ncbi:MAG: hypothetical protein F2667_11985, partial [Actinobacteria bacterium]|nr:hypothetical protein [Actinomycetota bacterium]
MMSIAGPPPGRSRMRGAGLVVSTTVAASLLLGWAGLPSAVLFGSLLGGMAHALTSPTPL